MYMLEAVLYACLGMQLRLPSSGSMRSGSILWEEVS